MRAFTVNDAAAIVGGRLIGKNINVPLGSIVIDSRSIMPGDVFAAYKGEKVDGHDYMDAAFDKGAVCCIAQHCENEPKGTVILVDDVQEAIEKLAKAYRASLNIPVVGITGSVGKTSAKEMIAAVLSRRMNILKTDKNLNNQIGVPMTVSRIEAEHEAAVIEMGISGFGEMSALADIVRPTVAVFTMIGHAHLEFLHDLKGVLKAKTEMLDYMSEDSVVIFNGDDALLRDFQCRQRRLLFGLGNNCDIRAEDITVSELGETDCTICFAGRRVSVHIPAYGKHMVYAALEGAAVGFVLGLSDDEIAAGIADYKTVGRRCAVSCLKDMTLIDDCYNANPDSSMSGIESLMMLKGRHVCIFGDMLELGENSPRMHYELGEFAAEKGVDLVLTSGTLAGEISRGAGERGVHFATRDELLEALPRYIKPGDVILVKASNGSRFDVVSETIKKMGEANE